MAHPSEFFIKYLLILGDDLSLESINTNLELYGISTVTEKQMALYKEDLKDVPSDFRPWEKSHRPSTSWLKKKRIYSMVHPDKGTEEMKRVLADPRLREHVERLILGNVSFIESSHRLAKLGTPVSDVAISEYKHYFWNTDVMGITDWASYIERDSTRRTAASRSAYSLALLAGPEVAMYRIGVDKQIDSKKIMLQVQSELYHTFLETKTLPLSSKKVEMLTGLARGLARIDERVQAGDTALQETLKKFEKFKVLHSKNVPPNLLELAPTGSISDRSREEILTSGKDN